MNDSRIRRIAKTALLGLILGASAACEEPAKSAADAKDGGANGSDRHGDVDKSHCAGDER